VVDILEKALTSASLWTQIDGSKLECFHLLLSLGFDGGSYLALVYLRLSKGMHFGEGGERRGRNGLPAG
jgi:hypothetical protein